MLYRYQRTVWKSGHPNAKIPEYPCFELEFFLVEGEKFFLSANIFFHLFPIRRVYVIDFMSPLSALQAAPFQATNHTAVRGLTFFTILLSRNKTNMQHGSAFLTLGWSDGKLPSSDFTCNLFYFSLCRIVHCSFYFILFSFFWKQWFLKKMSVNRIFLHCEFKS